MAKYVNTLIMDNGLSYLKSNGNRLVLCAGQPASYADATTNSGAGGKALGHLTIASTDLILADDGSSGRKITVGAKTGITIDVTGTCDHIAIVDTVNSNLLFVTTVTGQVVTAANTANTAAYTDDIAAGS